MPNLKVQLDELFSDAADHEMLIRVDGRSKDAKYHQRAKRLQTQIEQIRGQIAERRHEGSQFVLEQAAKVPQVSCWTV